ncbi:MAG: beta strand repeat-containing protein [Marinicellaceae bacterium]
MITKTLKPQHILYFLLLMMTTQAMGVVGLAKQGSNLGRNVEYSLYLENFINEEASITLSDDLDVVFGAGNYNVTNRSIVSGSGLTLDLSYDGSSSNDFIATGTLAPFATAQIDISVEITTVTDQGSGVGVFDNTAFVFYVYEFFDSGDDSTNGTDPDPDGNNIPDEDIPTRIDLLQNPALGLAKNATVSGNNVIFDFYIENLGNREMFQISLTDDLDNTFGIGNYTINSAPVFIDDPFTMVINPSYDGSSQTNLLDTGSSLVVSDTAQIQLQVTVNNEVDLGNGLGVYSNQAEIIGNTAFGNLDTDLSDSGMVVDANNNNNASDTNEDDPTLFAIGQEPSIGLAKTATVMSSDVVFDLYLENLGNTELLNVSITDDLSATFGLGNYFVSIAPTLIDDPGTITINPNFDGNFDTELLDSTNSSINIGDTAQIQFIVSVINLADVGSGLGQYSNQAMVSAITQIGTNVVDASDDGTDPDPNADDNANQAGENDATAFIIAPISRIGISKEFINLGIQGGFNSIEFEFTITNFGNQVLSNISVSDDLNAVYGAGNYFHTLDPEFTGGINSLTYNSTFDGSSNTTMVTGGSIAPAQTVKFRIRHLLDNLTDQGLGVGIYENQVTVIATDPEANPVVDVSHEGNDPDSNGDNNPNEMDPTVINANQIAVIGSAIDANVTGNLVTLDYYFENFGNIEIEQLQMLQNLDEVFGEGNYTITTAPFLVDDPGTLLLNSEFDGTLDKDLIDLTMSSLFPGDTAQIQMVVEVSVVANVGLGIGVYELQGIIGGVGSQGQILTDVSDFGTDADPNGNSDPTEAGENDATSIIISASTLLGVALDAAIAGNVITYDIYLESFGSDTLSSLSLIESLDDAFGAGNYQITTPPSFIDDPGTLVLNANFDGSTDIDILDPSSTFSANDTAQIQFVVQVDTESDQGNGFGIYNNQVSASGTLPNSVIVADVSDEGTNPDPNGNDDPTEAGENDPTVSIIEVNPQIGIAYKATVVGTQVNMDFTVENLGDSTLTNITMENPLNPVFGSGNYSVTTQATRISGAETLTYNFQYFGFSVFDFILVGGFLRPGESETFRVVVNVTTESDQGNGLGVYLNGVMVNATTPSGSPVSDISDDGIDPDPNGNGNADETGENDETRIIIGDEAIAGLATDVNVSGSLVTVDLYLENFGASTLNNITLPIDLNVVFGAGNYSINTAPVFIDDPGTLTLNGGFNGSGDSAIISAGSSLATIDTAQIQLVIDVTNIQDVGLGFGQYSLQSNVQGTAPLGTVAVDVSDDGTDPDPNGNNLANDEGESDLSLFSVGFSSAGLAKTVTLDPLDSSQSTFDVTLFIENLGLVAINGIQINDDLDTVFGAGNYTVTKTPEIQGDGRGLSGNSNFNGSSDTFVLDPNNPGSMPASTIVEVNFSVRVDQAADLGSGFGVYSNQALLSVNSPVLMDLSDSGTDPDPSGDNLSDGMGEDDPTQFSLVAQAPEFTLSFSPSTVGLNGITTVTYSINNSTSPFDVTTLDFSNALPAGLVIASPSNLSNSCNGTVTAVDTTTTVSLTGGTVDAQSSCSITVDMQATASGLLVNTTGDLTSSSGNSGTASDTLDSDPPPVVTAPADINMEATANLTPVMLGMAIVTDDRDMGLTATPDNLGPFAVGSFTVTWTSDPDSSGNISTAQQMVTITDNSLPVITLLGQPTVVVRLGDAYSDAGATASDIVDGDLTNDIDTVNPVDINTDADYTVTYNVMDSAMNAAVEVTRLVIVDAPPTILAPADISTEATGLTTPVALGMPTVSDLRDMGLTATADNTGPFTVGTTVVTWTTDADSAGNVSTDTQTITIFDSTPPDLILNGSAVIDLLVGDTYIDAGATANDLVDGDLTNQIIPTNPVDTSLAGVYTVNYSVTDANGNSNSIDRTVNVRAIIGGTVAGLTGGEMVVISDGSQQLTLSNGVYSFMTEYDAAAQYTVNIVTQPGGPVMQTCMLSNQTGMITAGNVTNIDINCAIDAFALNVEVTGLDPANTIELSTNGQSLPIANNGSFNFPMPIEDGLNYAVVVNAQPMQPSQECSVTGGSNNDGSGTISGNDVLVSVDCITNSYLIGGLVSGLEIGNEITLSLNNGSETLLIDTNSTFVFNSALLDLSAYSVTVTEDTSQPSQTCNVNNGSGNLDGQDIVDVEVVCSIDQFFIGGQLTGLLDGDTVTIQNNATDDLVLSENGAFVFSTPLDDLESYNVSILKQTGSDGLRCTIKSNIGLLDGTDITNVFVNCDGINELIFKDGFESLQN